MNQAAFLKAQKNLEKLNYVYLQNYDSLVFTI